MNQMDKNKYRNVRLAIGDDNREVRLTLKSQFNSFGFINILNTDSLLDIRKAVIRDQIDVIICADSIDPGFSKFIYDIRHQRIGHNPFIVVIATIDDLSALKVKSLTDSGIDDIVVRPISVGKLVDRLTLIARSRKPFIVTTDYTGPDRRKDTTPRPGSQSVPLIDVPNPLVYLMGKNKGKTDISEAISKASDAINEQKMERHAFQISYLVNQIAPYYKDGLASEVETKDLDRIIFISSDINKRLKNTRFSDAVDLCTSMADLAKNIRNAHPNPTDKDMELFPVLSQAIQLAFQSTDDGSVSVSEIIEKLKSQNVFSSKKNNS